MKKYEIELLNDQSGKPGNERFYVKLPTDNRKTVLAEYTEAVSDKAKELLVQCFGISFLKSAPEQLGNLIKHEFEAEQNEIELFVMALKAMANKSIIDSVDIINS